MNAESDLYSTLSTATQVTNVVGSRIYPDVVPRGVATPCIAFSRVDTEYVMTIHGTLAATRATFELWCMAEQRSAADRLADAVLPVIYSQRFVPTGRRAEFDDESKVWSTVLLVDYWKS